VARFQVCRFRRGPGRFREARAGRSRETAVPPSSVRAFVEVQVERTPRVFGGQRKPLIGGAGPPRRCVQTGWQLGRAIAARHVDLLLFEPGRLGEVYALDPRQEHERTIEVDRSREARVAKAGARQIGVRKAGSGQFRPIEIRPSEFGFLEARTRQSGAAEIGALQFGIDEGRLFGGDTREITAIGFDLRKIRSFGQGTSHR